MITPAVYAGSFDPVTNGHIDIALRARDIFGEVILLVIPNASKQPLFTQEERVKGKFNSGSFKRANGCAGREGGRVIGGLPEEEQFTCFDKGIAWGIGFGS